MTFVARSRSFALACSAAILIILTPQLGGAGTIQIYGIPDHYRHQYYPCVFAGNDGCHDPVTWPAPAQSTSNAWTAPTLYRTYTGADLNAWTSVVGSSFVLGEDFNTTVDHGTLAILAIEFWVGASLDSSWNFPNPMVTPDLHNGDGYADFVFAAGCSGTVAAIGATGLNSCTLYTPFVMPAGTTEIRFAFGYSLNRNDGDDDLYAIAGNEQPLPEVPEPATLLLLSTGLFVTAWRLRRRA